VRLVISDCARSVLYGRLKLKQDIWKQLDAPRRALLEARKDWMAAARPKQITPPDDRLTSAGKQWMYWLLNGGRGVGKTRTGAEDIAWWGGMNSDSRIAIIAPTTGDARDTCVEGVSGLMSVLPPICVKSWNRSLGELGLFNGTKIKCFSAEEPDRLRGPQHHRAWCDELAAWRYEEAWDQLMFGLRLGQFPRVIITTTPRPTKLVRQLIADPLTIMTREGTFANEANLSRTALDKLKERYSGTRLGRQELEAEVLDDVAGALWTRDKIDANRRKLEDVPDMQRVVVGVDPAVADPANVSDGDGRAETGIIVAGLGVDGRGYVLSDLSCRLSPRGWADRAVSGYDQFDGDAIVAETNQGGAMVTSTIRAVRSSVKVITVHAAKGKVTRAEPISALYEQGRISHVGNFPQLEDQQVAFTPLGIVGDTTGDRVDALVWAFSELFPRMTKKTSRKDVSGVGAKTYQPHNF
jgi:phage terminase large subunit-like protein